MKSSKNCDFLPGIIPIQPLQERPEVFGEAEISLLILVAIPKGKTEGSSESRLHPLSGRSGRNNGNEPG